MDHATGTPEQLSRMVFWIVMFSAVAFVAGVLILIR
jgi:hypothetical protein